MSGRIIDELLLCLKNLAADSNIIVEDVVRGLGYTAVRLETGHTGLCYSFQAEFCPRASRMHGLAGKMAGSKSQKLANMARSRNLHKRVIGVATINALSSIALEKKSQDFIISRGNIYDEIKLSKQDTVCVVGNIRPLVRRIRQKVQKTYVLEKDPTRRESHILPDTASEDILPSSTVVIVTGTALVNGTLERLLELSEKAREIAVVGASASVLPGPLFRRGVTIVGGIRVLDSDRVLQIVAEGGGTHELKEATEFVNMRPT